MRNSICGATFVPAIAVLALTLGGSAHAATTTFTDKSTFLSGLTTTIVDDYSNPGYQTSQTNSAMSAVVGQSTYVSSRNINWVQYGQFNAFVGVCSLDIPRESCTPVDADNRIGFESTSLSSAAGVFAVGFDYFENGALAKVTFGDGSTQSINLLLPILPTFPDTSIYPRFFGIQSDLGIKSIDFYGFANPFYNIHTEQYEGVYAGGRIDIDNLTIGSNSAVAAVPEPATWAMMIAGFFGVGVMARRRGRLLAA